MLGVQLYLAREGTDYGGVVSADNAKPANPTTAWDKLMCVEQWDPTNDKTEIILRCPVNGVWVNRKVITTGRSLMHNFQAQQWDDMTLVELLLNGSAPDGSGDFIPNGATDDVRGWLYCEIYNHDDSAAPLLTLDTWTQLSIGSHQFKESLEPHTLKANVIQSALNAGNIVSLA